MSKSKKPAPLLSNLIVRKGEAKASPFTPAGSSFSSFAGGAQAAPNLTPDPTPAMAAQAAVEPEPEEYYEEPEETYEEPEETYEEEEAYEEEESYEEPEELYEEPDDEEVYEEQPEAVYEEPEEIYEEPAPAPVRKKKIVRPAPAPAPQQRPAPSAAVDGEGSVNDLARITKAMRAKPEPAPDPKPQQPQASVDFASAREAKSGKRPFGRSDGDDAEAPASGKRTAHTLRLDAERHLKLKVYSVFTRMTIQKVLTDALDDYLERVAPQSVPGWHRLNEESH